MAGAVLIVAALLFDGIRLLLREVHYADVVAQIAAEPWSNLVLAVLATAVSYLVLTEYDASALRYAGAQVRRPVVMLTSFIAYALGNTVGLGVLTGGAVRMRLYTAAGIDAGQVTQAVAFNAGAFAIGMVTFGAAALLWGASDVAALVHLPVWLLRSVAVVVLLGVAASIVISGRRSELRIARLRLRLPTPALALRQLAVSALDLGASAAALWFLLPAGVIDLPAFFAWYAMAVALGLISHVPGGLGVFEAVILLACGGRAAPSEIVSALVLYRFVYYVLPLLVAAVLLAAYELRAGVAAPIARAAVAVSPMLLATLTFIAGTWLLISGATPATGEATDLLELHVPLPLVEAAHFIGSVAGLAMLVVARGLLQRLDAAWWSAFLLAVVAAVLALPKGIAWSEAAYLTVLALLLLSSRREFNRRSALFAPRLSAGWMIAVGCVVAATVGILFFAYREVDYHRELWWQFEFDAHAPRSLRAVMAITIAGLSIALWQLLRHSAPTPKPPTTEQLDRAAAIVEGQAAADAKLVLMGDKHLMFAESGRAFLMYGRHGRSWISLFDPVGPMSEWPELIWRFMEVSAEAGGRAAFYQIRPQGLSFYLDAGLHAFKLGEYASVPLPDFSLKGSRRSGLRHAMNRATRDGLSFSLVSVEEVPPLLPTLRQISDAWLGESSAREKGFSLGAFDERYLVRQPLALVKQGERLVAFANIMCTSFKEEASVDLMRQLPDSPSSSMEFLFVQLLLHYQAQGFERFGLGMAPLSGMASHQLAPRWHRFGRLLFDHGERFYNFRGLRSFKEKFDPVWEPRYLAAPRGLSSLRTLADITALIGGGLRGVISK